MSRVTNAHVRRIQEHQCENIIEKRGWDGDRECVCMRVPVSRSIDFVVIQCIVVVAPVVVVVVGNCEISIGDDE